MAIKIVNNRFHKPTDNDISIARPSILGNIYCHLDSDFPDAVKVSTREEAVSLYTNYFLFQYKENQEFKEIIDDLTRIAKTQDINLACWCVSCDIKENQCHGSVIKRFIEYKLKKEKNNV